MFLHGARLPIRERMPELTRDARLAITVSPYRSRMIPIVNRNAEAYPEMVYIPQDIATLEVLLHGHAGTLAEADACRCACADASSAWRACPGSGFWASASRGGAERLSPR